VAKQETCFLLSSPIRAGFILADVQSDVHSRMHVNTFFHFDQNIRR